MKTYLSIDLDFWNSGVKSFPHLRKFLRMAKEEVAKSKLVIVDSHEELLPYVSDSGCDTLVNVDWHSDITNRYDPNKDWHCEFNCGTWINYVDWRKKGHYVWYYPYESSRRDKVGHCHWPRGTEHNPFIHSKYAGWKSLTAKKSRNPENHIDWRSISHVGISFSYDWTKYGKITEMAEKILGFKPEPNPNARL